VTPDPVLAKLEELRSDISILSVKLFGEESGENPKGRLPLLESEVKSVREQCDKHENTKHFVLGAVLLNIGSAGLWLKSHLGIK